jgi:hypothetical protein
MYFYKNQDILFEYFTKTQAGRTREISLKLHGVQGAGGSNPLAPTNKIKGL